MKRYALFAGEFYYPCGGWEDFVQAFDTSKEAHDYFKTNKKQCGNWYQVIDLQTGDTA